VARVGQLVGFLACLSVGWTFVGQFGWFFLYIIFIGNKDKSSLCEVKSKMM
jgi:hypothetical protein